MSWCARALLFGTSSLALCRREVDRVKGVQSIIGITACKHFCERCMRLFDRARKSLFSTSRSAKKFFSRNDLIFHLLICLGIIAISACIPLLELFASWFGRLSIFPLPGLCALLFYFLLIFLQPHIFVWPKYRSHYLIVVFLASFALIVWGPAQLRFLLLIMLYGLIVHARVTFSDTDCLLIEGSVILATLVGILLTGGTEFEEPLRRTIVALGIGTKEPTALLQFCIWLLGLFFLHVFVGLGVHERVTRRKSELLVKELTRTQQQLREYAMRAEELAIVRERARVAREIHDTLAQGLAAIKMHLEIEAATYDGKGTPLHLERVRELAGALLDETRHSIFDLRTEALDGSTLPEALNDLALSSSSPESEEGTTVSFLIDKALARSAIWLSILPTVSLACYRIAQEALTNAQRHGKAEHVSIELSVEAGELCLTVTDNGCGFAVEAVAEKNERSSFGIIGMRERTSAAGGSLEVISAPSVGTQVVAMIPLSSTAVEVDTL